MLDKRETKIVLERFFNDCLKFWTRQGCDEREAFEKSLADIKAIKNDPFYPRGRVLNEEAKLNFIRYREMDLGKKGE